MSQEHGLLKSFSHCSTFLHVGCQDCKVGLAKVNLIRLMVGKLLGEVIRIQIQGDVGPTIRGIWLGHILLQHRKVAEQKSEIVVPRTCPKVRIRDNQKAAAWAERRAGGWMVHEST